MESCRLTERPFTEFAKLYPGHYLCEPKWDGERVLVNVTQEKVELSNRHGTTYDFSFLPDYEAEVRSAVRNLALPLVLDAEFISGKKADLYQFLKDRVQEIQNTQIIVFDILMLGGVDLRGKTLLVRRGELSQLVKTQRVQPIWFELARTQDAVWQFYNQMTLKSKFEGIIAKPVNSIYTDGAWCKLKKTVTHDVVILAIKKTEAWKRGDGARSFLIGFVDENGETVPYGDVSSGWQRVDLSELRPTGLSDDDYIYVAPTIVVELMAHSLLESRKFREPRILRTRVDKRPQECKIPDGH